MAQMVKNMPASRRLKFDPWRREGLPTPVLLPGEFHGQRSMVGSQSMGLQSQTQLSDFHFHFFTSKGETHINIIIIGGYAT